MATLHPPHKYDSLKHRDKDKEKDRDKDRQNMIRHRVTHRKYIYRSKPKTHENTNENYHDIERTRRYTCNQQDKSLVRTAL